MLSLRIWTDSARCCSIWCYLQLAGRSRWSWIHGGAWLRGSNKPYATPVPVELIRDSLLDAGIAVASVQYRLSGEAIFPAQIHDVKAAVRWLLHHAAELRLDPSRFGAWGDSAGGHLAALLAVTGNVTELEGDVGVTGVSSSIQACVDWYGPTHLASMRAQAHPLATDDHDAPSSPTSRLVGAPNPDGTKTCHHREPWHACIR